MTRRIVLVDRSRAVVEQHAMRDSTLAILREGDVLIAYDTAVSVIATRVRDTASVLASSEAPASLSVALVAAERAAAILRDRADSIELAIISPFSGEGWDDATPVLRARWRGRARLVTLPLVSPDAEPPAIDVRAPHSDPVSVAAAPFLKGTAARTRIVRDLPSAADSVWASGPDHVLVRWPRAGDDDSLTAEGVVANDVVLVAPLVRRAVPHERGPVIARFADGAAAIVEHVHGEGCVRDVAFDFPARGDVPLRESARGLLAVIAAPCQGTRAGNLLSAARLSFLRGEGALLATSAVPRPTHARSEVTPWLLIAGALLLLLELGARRRAGSP